MPSRRVRHLMFSSKALGFSGAWFVPSLQGKSDGDLISSVPNLGSASSSDASASGSQRPTYKASLIGGMPMLRFDGASNYLTLGTSSSLQPAALTSVVAFSRYSDWSSVNMIFFWCKPNGVYNGNGWYHDCESYSSITNYLFVNGANAYFVGSGTVAANTVYGLSALSVLMNTFDSTPASTFTVNGSTYSQSKYGSPATITSTSDAKYFGCNSPGYGGGYIKADVGFAGIASSVLSAAIKRRIQQSFGFLYRAYQN